MKTYIFDNGGKTFDRYTIVTGEGEVYGSSFDPFHPQGFGQYCGHVIELNSNMIETARKRLKAVVYD